MVTYCVGRSIQVEATLISLLKSKALGSVAEHLLTFDCCSIDMLVGTASVSAVSSEADRDKPLVDPDTSIRVDRTFIGFDDSLLWTARG